MLDKDLLSFSLVCRLYTPIYHVRTMVYTYLRHLLFFSYVLEWILLFTFLRLSLVVTYLCMTLDLVKRVLGSYQV